MIDPTNQIVALDMLTKMNGMYQGAVTHILTLAALIVGFSGIIIPVLLFIVQNRLAKAEEAKIDARVSQAVQTALVALKAEFESYRKHMDERLEEAMSELAEFQKAEAGRAFASTLHLQGGEEYRRKEYASSAVSYLEAAGKYLLGGDHYNLLRCLTDLDKRVLPNLTREDFESERLEERFRNILHLLEANNHKNVFREWIDSFIVDVPVAKKREKKNDDTKDAG